MSDCIPEPEDSQGGSDFVIIEKRKQKYNFKYSEVCDESQGKSYFFISQVKDFVKYCMNEDVTSSERLNEVLNTRGIVLDGDEDFSQIERLRRPKKSPPSLKSGRTNQLSNRDRLLRFHQTN